MRGFLLVLVALIPFAVGSAQAPAVGFDVVIVGGRVMDPESKLDGVRSIGIRGGKIVAISAGPLKGKTMTPEKIRANQVYLRDLYKQVMAFRQQGLSVDDRARLESCTYAVCAR